MRVLSKFPNGMVELEDYDTGQVQLIREGNILKMEFHVKQGVQYYILSLYDDPGFKISFEDGVALLHRSFRNKSKT